MEGYTVNAAKRTVEIRERAGRFFYVVDGQYAILNHMGALISYGRRADAERMLSYWVGVGIYPRSGQY